MGCISSRPAEVTGAGGRRASVIPDSATLNTASRRSLKPLSKNLKLNFKTDFSIERHLPQGGDTIISIATILNKGLKTRSGCEQAVVKQLGMNVEVESFKYQVSMLNEVCFPPNPNILSFFGYFEKPYGLAMKVYTCSLSDYIFNDSIDLSPKTLRKAILDIAKGYNHLHSIEIVHFNVKPSNILLEVDPNGLFTCVVGDFGFARVYGAPLDQVKELVNSAIESKDVSKAREVIPFCSPEIFEQMIKSSEPIFCNEGHRMCDIYSFGISIFEIISRTRAWNELPSLKSIPELISKPLNKRPNLSTLISKKFEGLNNVISVMESCWSSNVNERPSFESIVSDLSKNLLQ